MTTTEEINTETKKNSAPFQNNIDIPSLKGTTICLKAFSEEELDKMINRILNSSSSKSMVVSNLSELKKALSEQTRVFLIKTPTDWEKWDDEYLDRIEVEESVVFILDFAQNIYDTRILYNISDGLGTFDEEDNLIIEAVDIF